MLHQRATTGFLPAGSYALVHLGFANLESKVSTIIQN